jgi:peptidoglycan/LPS O-acetylase OafA/YrhL
VLPLYFTVLLGILLFIPHSAVTVAFAASFLMSFATTLPSVLKNPFWTLAIEEQFYILWPAVVRRRSTTQLARFAIGVAVASFVLRLLFAVKGHYNYFLTPLRCDGLALGALLACRFDGRQRGELPARSDDRGLFLTLLGGVAFLLISILTPHSGRATAFAAAFEVSAVTLLCCAFIGFLIGHTGGRSVAIFRSPVLTFFGLISYAFYLLHFYVLYAYDRIRGPLVPGDTRGFFLRIAIAFAVTTILCLVSRYLIELPALSLRRYVLLRPTRPAETELPLTHAN